jgi:hypothetical protein
MSNFVDYFARSRNIPIEWEQAQLLLNEYLLELSNFVNAKSIGIYSSQETPSGKQLQLTGTPYDLLRKTIDFGALPNAGSKPIAHGITVDSGFRLFNLYLAANNLVGTSYFCLQYFSIAAADITLEMDATNVIVTTASDYSAYTDCYVIIEYARGVA